MNKVTISGLLVLFSAIFIVPSAIAQAEPFGDNRTEKYQDLTETEVNSSEAVESIKTAQSNNEEFELETRPEETLEDVRSNDSSSNYDVRRTEAFDLVRSAYRGDFEEQGVNSYATLVSNYETGELTAEDLIKAAIESGELSPNAMEDESYVRAVDDQLDSLVDTTGG